MLLKKIAATNDGILLTPFNLENGVSIQVGKEIIASEYPNRRNYTKWDAILKNCINWGYIEQKNKDVYALTNLGYKYVDENEDIKEIELCGNTFLTPESLNTSIHINNRKSPSSLEGRILESGEVMEDILGAIKTNLENSFEKRILYVSNSVSDNEVALLRTDYKKFVDINEFGIDTSNRKVIYRLCGIAIFKRKVDEFLNQNVVVSARVGDVLIESITTFDNWKSKSYANNVLSAEEYECTIWFKILSDKDNLCKVQILLIEEY